MTRRNDEALLERLILREFGRATDVALYRNEVGEGYPCAELRASLFSAFGSSDQRVLQAINRCRRVHYGLGVGSPDLVGAVRGIFVGLELKTSSGRVSDGQADWSKAAQARGLTVAVVRSVDDASDVIEALRRR